MAFESHRVPVFAILLAWAISIDSSARGQSGPGAADAKSIRERFLVEREEAVKARFAAETLARADELAKRGENALREDPKAAARYFRDARWQLPYLPAGLPDHVVRVLGESRMRHADRINALAYSPDGTRLASASRDGTVKIWDLGNGRELITYRGHLDQPDDPTQGGSIGGTDVFRVADVAYHPKEKVIASVCGNQVHLWDPETGKPIKTILNIGKVEKPLKTLAYSPDGKYLAVGGDDGILRVIESDTGKEKYKSPSRNARLERVTWSPNGNMVALGDGQGQVAVYAPNQPNQLAMAVQGVDVGGVLGVAFTADSGAVLTCGSDGRIRLTAGPKPDGTSAGNTASRLSEYLGHTGAVTSLALVPKDGALFVTGGEDKSVRVWEVASKKQLRSFLGHLSRVSAVAVRGDGMQFASGSEDGAIRMWDLNAIDEHRALTDATDSLWAVAYSPDGKRVAAAGADRSIRVYQTDTGKLEATLTGARSPITSLAFFPDSNRLVAAGGDRIVVVWDIAQQKPIKEFRGHESAILSVAVSDDGKLIVSGGAVGDRTVRAFTMDADKPAWVHTARSAVCAVAIRKGAKQVAVGLADGTLVTLDVSGATPKETGQSAHVAGVACVAYSPDGTRLVTVGGDGVLRVWSVAPTGTLTQLVKFDGQAKSNTPGTFTPLTGVAFAPDGRYVAAVGADAIVRVWDVETKSEVRGLRGHLDWVTAVAFSPDGRSIASVGVDKDRALRIFELPQLDTSPTGGHALAVNAVAVSADGKTIATASIDQTIKLWDRASGRLLGTLIGSSDVPLSLAFLGSDGLVLGTQLPNGVTGRLHFWRSVPGALTNSVASGEVFSVAAAPDGSRIAAWASRQAVGESKNNAYELYDAKGNLLSSLTDKGREVSCATFSTDLAWAVAGDDAGTVRIWDLGKKERVGEDYPVHVNRVVDLGITPDKKMLVAVDAKGLVKIANIADAKAREVMGSVFAHKGGARAILVSPSGTTFLTVGNDNEIKLWSLAADAIKEPKAIRSWKLPVSVNGAAYTPDATQVVTANSDGTAYVLQLPGGDRN
jgi:WD40 repeat protein